MSIASRSIYLPLLVVLTGLICSPVPAAELKGGPETVVTDTTATINWTTDVATGTRLSYGLNEQRLIHQAEGEVSGQHSIRLTDLEPGTIYYFSFGTARVPLGTGKFTTTGVSSKQAPSALSVVPPIKKSETTPPAGEAVKPKKSLLERLFPSVGKDVKTAPVSAVPPTRLTWGHVDSLQDHFDRHGRDFNATSPDDYASMAWQFLQRAKRDGLPMKWDDSDHSLRVFDPKTRAFASYDSRGKTRTYFKPSNPNYWAGQPGRPISGAQLNF